MLRKFAVQISSALLFVATPAISELAPAICAFEQVISCGPFEPCDRNLPAALNLPTLIKIDHDANIVLSRANKGTERKSPIGETSEVEGGYAISGVDKGNPWVLLVESETGRFTFTSPRADVGFIGFGVCASKILD